jgi:hypothetical protein
MLASCGLLWHPSAAWQLMVGTSEKVNPDVYRLGRHRWMGDSILVHVYRTSDSSSNASLPHMTAECASCDFVYEPVALKFDSAGNAAIYFPEAGQRISARLHLAGKGIDTTFIQKERSPEDAMTFYRLSEPLVGRVMVIHMALLYSDTTQDSVLTTTDQGDELNIYGSQGAFYAVEHPNFTKPLYLLKSEAFRIE